MKSLSALSPRNRNRIASAAIVVGIILVIAVTWWNAPSRKVDHLVGAVATQPPLAAIAPQAADPSWVPRRLEPLWAQDIEPRSDVDATMVRPEPIVVGEVLLLPEAQGVQAINIADGSPRWHYRRDIALCALSTSHERVLATFDGPAGCGETVSLEPDTGAYAATRRSTVTHDDDAGPAAAIRSNSYAGIYTNKFLELWRSDLVRVVEYGQVPANNEPGFQPNAECGIVSALTRLEFLAVLNDCSGSARLVLQSAKPEKSREPEVAATVELGPLSHDLALVAIAEDAVALRHNDTLTVYRGDGTRLDSYALPPVAPSALAALGELSLGGKNQQITDLPHHMAWFSERGLLGLRPTNLDVGFHVADAVGTPAAWGRHLFIPLDGAVAVWDGDAVVEIGTLELPRGAAAPASAGSPAAQSTPVHLATAGNVLLVERGNRVEAFTIVP